MRLYAHEHLRSRQLQDRKTADDEALPDVRMTENLPELIGCQAPLLQLEIRKASQIRGIYKVEVGVYGEIV